MKRAYQLLVRAAMAFGLLGSTSACILIDGDWGWEECQTRYEYDEFGFCNATDCWGTYAVDNFYCDNQGGGACLDDMCLEGCYYDDASGGCIETSTCFRDSDCLGSEVCDLDRFTCVPEDRAQCQEGVCGDLVINAGEQCDDGNFFDGDGCSSACTLENFDAEDCADWADNDFDGAIDCADSDCANDPFCFGGFCGDGIVSTGEQCDDGNNESGDGCDSLCQVEQVTNEICNDGADNDTDGTVDCADSDCANDPACAPECVTDSDCGPGQVCTDGVCCDTGECIPNGRDPVCQFDYECGNGACVDGFCHDACIADSECPTGQTCQDGLCLTDPDGGDECVFNADCVADGNGEFCINGICHEGCNSENDCAGNENCRGTICQPDDLPSSECNVNADCPINGQECVNAVCRFACDNDSDCETSCGTGSACDLGYCLFPNEVNPECQVNEDCTSGLDCIDAQCIPSN
jgi:cysteine-rich repeat protein